MDATERARLRELAAKVQQYPERKDSDSIEFIALACNSVLPLLEQVERMEKALRGLTDAVIQVESHPDYRSVFESAFIHGVKYGGPNWGNELKLAMAALRGEETKK